MKESVMKKAAAYKAINELSLKGEIVVFGSTYMANFPFYELINRSRLERAVYNRSIPGLTLSEALEIVDDCVLSIRPSKVFLALGEEDLTRADAFADYKKLVDTIRSALPDSSLYLIDLLSDSDAAKAFNKQIASLCDRKNVFPLDLAAKDCPKTTQYKEQFLEMSRFFRRKPITFADAFAAAAL